MNFQRSNKWVPIHKDSSMYDVLDAKMKPPFEKSFRKLENFSRRANCFKYICAEKLQVYSYVSVFFTIFENT